MNTNEYDDAHWDSDDGDTKVDEHETRDLELVLYSATPRPAEVIDVLAAWAVDA